MIMMKKLQQNDRQSLVGYPPAILQYLITDNVWQDDIADALFVLSKATKRGFTKHYSSFQEILNLCDLSMKRSSPVEP
jgi:hypothetical protein